MLSGSAAERVRFPSARRNLHVDMKEDKTEMAKGHNGRLHRFSARSHEDQVG